MGRTGTIQKTLSSGDEVKWREDFHPFTLSVRWIAPFSHVSYNTLRVHTCTYAHLHTHTHANYVWFAFVLMLATVCASASQKSYSVQWMLQKSILYIFCVTRVKTQSWKQPLYDITNGISFVCCFSGVRDEKYTSENVSIELLFVCCYEVPEKDCSRMFCS